MTVLARWADPFGCDAMAWIRTSLSMISFGFTIGKLGKVLQAIEYQGCWETLAR